MNTKKEYPKPRTLAELNEIDPLSAEEDARIRAAIAEDPDDFETTEWSRNLAGSGSEVYPDGPHNPPRPTPEYIERCRKYDPEFAKRLEQEAREAEEWHRRRAAENKIAAAE
ncbi:MAG: hypothetical protein ACYYKD_13550 [Rhodospirillales bacterium]